VSDLEAPPSPAAGVDPLTRPAPPRTWRERVEQLADATGTTPMRILGGGIAVAVLAAGCLWLLRPPAEAPEVVLPHASTTMASEATTSTVATVVVHVAGR
jgi:hypothetical protein